MKLVNKSVMFFAVCAVFGVSMRLYSAPCPFLDSITKTLTETTDGSWPDTCNANSCIARKECTGNSCIAGIKCTGNSCIAGTECKGNSCIAATCEGVGCKSTTACIGTGCKKDAKFCSNVSPKLTKYKATAPTCPAGFKVKKDGSACFKCDAGTYISDDESNCFTCPAGTTSYNASRGVCIQPTEVDPESRQGSTTSSVTCPSGKKIAADGSGCVFINMG